jgi:hypothetical protein
MFDYYCHMVCVPITAKNPMVVQHAPMSAHSCIPHHRISRFLDRRRIFALFAFCSVELRVLCGDGDGDCVTFWLSIQSARVSTPSLPSSGNRGWAELL